PFTGAPQLHTGIDIAADSGTPIVATGDGVVVRTGWNGSYGRGVVLQHAKRLENPHAPISSVDGTVGETITRGTRLGRVGSSGNSTGPHVHYEVRLNGTPCDPSPYILTATLVQAHLLSLDEAHHS